MRLFLLIFKQQCVDDEEDKLVDSDPFPVFLCRRLDIAAPLVNRETGRIIKSTVAKGEGHSL